jgi:predicted HTH domain antitoxin
MATVTVEVPESAFSALRRSPDEFAREMRIAAAIQWYHQELISQGKAAEIAGLTRADFLEALFRAKVPACQITVEELKEELSSGGVDCFGPRQSIRVTQFGKKPGP